MDLSSMDFSERVDEIARRQRERIASIDSEEGAKHALVMPVLAHVLGYNVFEPSEVVPEFTADIGERKGERVDYALMHEGVPAVLIECKPPNATLGSKQHLVQLSRYFMATDAKFAVLTNGIQWRFHSDLDQDNRLDDEPYFVFDFGDYDRDAVEMLRQYAKADFDARRNATHALEAKFTRRLVERMKAEMDAPSREHVRHWAKQVYDGMLTEKVLAMFEGLVKQASAIVITAKVRRGLKDALSDNDGEEQRQPATPTPEPRKRKSIAGPTSWVLEGREVATDGPYWYMLPDALLKHLAQDNEQFVEQVLMREIYHRSGDSMPKPLEVMPGVWRSQNMSTRKSLRKAVDLIYLSGGHPSDFHVTDTNGVSHRVTDAGDLTPIEDDAEAAFGECP